jgi:hypothetical protein
MLTPDIEEKDLIIIGRFRYADEPKTILGYYYRALRMRLGHGRF